MNDHSAQAEEAAGCTGALLIMGLSEVISSWGGDRKFGPLRFGLTVVQPPAIPLKVQSHVGVCCVKRPRNQVLTFWVWYVSQALLVFNRW